MISLLLSPCLWRTHPSTSNQWPSPSINVETVRTLTQEVPHSRTATTSWCLPSICQVNTHLFQCLSRITRVQVAALGTSRTLLLQGGVEATTRGIKRDSIRSSKGQWVTKRVKVKRITVMTVTQHRTIAAVKQWRVRKAVIERRSSSRIRWIKHRRL